MAHQTFMSFLSLSLITILGLSRASARTGAGAFVDRATQFISITGSTTGRDAQTNARPFRRNILDLQNDQPSWSLYIQCLAQMQNTNENDPLSWFQIGGIHGRPYISWNNIVQTANSGYGGYCEHNSILFPTWHRPYLALFEQTIATCAQGLAKQYQGVNLPVYQAAADKLRIPFWDWAAIPQLPDAVIQAYVTITTPAGIQTIVNPLQSYAFKQFPLDQNLFPPTTLSVFPRTIRKPTSYDAGATSDIAGINALLAAGNLMQRAWYSLVKTPLYNSFATTAVPGPSIEAVHNDVHGMTGGLGHMTYLDFSGFDPLFMLHHANVDRLFTIWQALNYYSQMTPALDGGTYALPQQNLDTVWTPLYPFTSSSVGQLYTSASSMTTAKFNYAYPEVEDWHQSPQDLKNNVSAQINQLYDPNGTFRRKLSDNLLSRHTLKPGDVSREWSVAVSVSKYDLRGGHFTIRLFLGDVPADPEDWALSDTTVGSMFIMPPTYGGQMPFPNIIGHDEWSLNQNIIAAGRSPNKAKDVVSYLKRNLNWRAQKTDGTVIDIKDIPSLQVSVFDQKLTMPKQITELPAYGKEKNLHVDITRNKQGGLTTSGPIV